MESKKRKTDNSYSPLSLELALFALDQVTDSAVLLLELQHEGKMLTPLFVNASFCEMFGVSRENISELVICDCISEKDVAIFTQSVLDDKIQKHKLRILTQRQHDNETKKIQKDARVTISQFSNNLVCCKFELCDPNLEEQLKWYQIASQHLGIPWSFLRVEEENQDFCVLFENDLCKSLKKYPDTAYYYKSYGHFPQDQLAWWVERVSRVNENHLIEVSTRETTSFGETHTYTIKHIFIHRDENGFPVVLGLCEAVAKQNRLQTMLTDQQKQMDELDSTNRCLRHFFDLAPLYMGIVRLVKNDTDTQFISANRCQESRYNFPLKGRYGSEIADPERIKIWIAYFLKAKVSEEVVQFSDFYLDPKTGQNYYFQAFCVYLGGDLFAYLSQDITQNRRLEEELKQHRNELEEKIVERTRQLQEALQVKSRFLATMSHEMRTPLSGSTGAMSLLEETPLTPDQRVGHGLDFVLMIQNLLRIAQVCGQQLLAVINDVLDLSKLEENKVVLDNEPYDIRNTLEESLEMVCFDASKKGLELIGVIDSSVPHTVIGDAGRIRQIIVNLLSNAIKFSSKGEIVLRASAKQLDNNIAEITMSVQDEGIGIQEEDKHKLFQVFTQLDNSVTRRHGGTGLGLSICRRLAELMQGKIWFESTVGKGSIFHTTILAPTVPLMNTTIFPGLPIKSLHCVIVDKSQTYANHLKNLLENLGNTVECFTKVEEIPPADCLFVDARLNLKSVQSRYKHIVLTSYTTHQVKIPSDYYLLEKPLRESRLKQLMDNIRSDSAPTHKPIEPTDNNTGKFSTNISILLAEDNEMNQQIIKRMLSNLSLTRVTVVSNGIEAIEEVKSKHYDLVLMDVMMPDMGGIEATEIIRKEVGEKPVIVALTANAFAEDRVRCLEAGMQEVLTKPVQKNQLIRIFKLYFPN